jgi:anti-anti-sigma factor
MTIEHWSDEILLAELPPEPGLSEDLTLVVDEVQANARHVVLNLANVVTINSSNLAQMLRVRKVVIEADRKLRLAGVSEQIDNVLSVTGLDRVFDVSQDAPSALASLQLDEDVT